jgi:hypothetical protein
MPTTLLRELAASNIRFILVDDLAAVTQGAPITTFDVDIVHDRAPDNVQRFAAFLHAHGAYYRGRPGDNSIQADEHALLGPGHHLFQTSLGPLDVLGAIEGGDDYDALLSCSIDVPLGEFTVRVLTLQSIVERKRASSHPKDKIVLPILEALLKKTLGH